MKRSDRFPSLVVKLLKLVAVLGLVSLVSNSLVSAEPPWPTPPPAPQAPRPQFEEDITPVNVPPLLGAASAVIRTERWAAGTGRPCKAADSDAAGQKSRALYA